MTMMTDTDPKVIPLQEEINKTLKRIDELEWDGDFKTAEFAKYHLDYLKKMEADGEIWYPLF